MPRLLLGDEHWSKLHRILLQNASSTTSLICTVEAMLYRMRTGCLWRDLPQALGCWNRIYKRFNAWSAAGKWIEIFKLLVAEPGLEWLLSMAVMPRHTSIMLGLTLVRTKQSGKVGQAIPARFIWQ